MFSPLLFLFHPPAPMLTALWAGLFCAFLPLARASSSTTREPREETAPAEPIFSRPMSAIYHDTAGASEEDNSSDSSDDDELRSISGASSSLESEDEISGVASPADETSPADDIVDDFVELVREALSKVTASVEARQKDSQMEFSEQVECLVRERLVYNARTWEKGERDREGQVAHLLEHLRSLEDFQSSLLNHARAGGGGGTEEVGGGKTGSGTEKVGGEKSSTDSGTDTEEVGGGKSSTGGGTEKEVGGGKQRVRKVVRFLAAGTELVEERVGGTRTSSAASRKREPSEDRRGSGARAIGSIFEPECEPSEDSSSPCVSPCTRRGSWSLPPPCWSPSCGPGRVGPFPGAGPHDGVGDPVPEPDPGSSPAGRISQQQGGDPDKKSSRSTIRGTGAFISRTRFPHYLLDRASPLLFAFVDSLQKRVSDAATKALGRGGCGRRSRAGAKGDAVSQERQNLPEGLPGSRSGAVAPAQMTVDEDEEVPTAQHQVPGPNSPSPKSRKTVLSPGLNRSEIPPSTSTSTKAKDDLPQQVLVPKSPKSPPPQNCRSKSPPPSSRVSTPRASKRAKKRRTPTQTPRQQFLELDQYEYDFLVEEGGRRTQLPKDDPTNKPKPNLTAPAEEPSPRRGSSSSSSSGAPPPAALRCSSGGTPTRPPPPVVVVVLLAPLHLCRRRQRRRPTSSVAEQSSGEDTEDGEVLPRPTRLTSGLVSLLKKTNTTNVVATQPNRSCVLALGSRSDGTAVQMAFRSGFCAVPHALLLDVAELLEFISSTVFKNVVNDVKGLWDKTKVFARGAFHVARCAAAVVRQEGEKSKALDAVFEQLLRALWRGVRSAALRSRFVLAPAARILLWPVYTSVLTMAVFVVGGRLMQHGLLLVPLLLVSCSTSFLFQHGFCGRSFLFSSHAVRCIVGTYHWGAAHLYVPTTLTVVGGAATGGACRLYKFL